MVRKSAFLALFLLVGAVFCNSCKKEELSSKKEILSFIFDARKNVQLDRNFPGDINGTDIQADVAFGVVVTNLVPTIEISPRATMSPSADQAQDFTGPVVYTVTAEDGTTKTFSTTVATAPAPYIGTWTGGPIDTGTELMRVNAIFTANGDFTLEFVKILTSEMDATSIKGNFEPISRQKTEIRVDLTHRWGANGWINETSNRTIMYDIKTPQNMVLYYCMNCPKTEWCLQINLTKD